MGKQNGFKWCMEWKFQRNNIFCFVKSSENKWYNCNT